MLRLFGAVEVTSAGMIAISGLSSDSPESFLPEQDFT
jgi:hypothetical protein